jgi:chorismate dehydratase
VDAGAFSYVDGLGLVESGEFEWLGSFGIAGQGPIQSILLCGVDGSAALKGQAIAISPQTATTVKLLEIWLKQKEGLEDFRFTGPDDNAVARLLIGDEALRRKLSLNAEEPQLDLSEVWTAWTGLPFVFARWAVRKTLPDLEKRALALTLGSALDLALDDLGHVAAEQARRSGLPADKIEAYLKGITYHLGPEQLAGAEEFKRRLDLL